MPLIFRYFWFVCAVFMAVNLVSWRSRFTTIVSRGSVTKAEADRFLRWAAVYLIAGPLVLGVIGLAAGWPSRFCASVLTFDTVPRALHLSPLMLASWVSLLWWIWRGAGADFCASRTGAGKGRRMTSLTRREPSASWSRRSCCLRRWRGDDVASHAADTGIQLPGA